VKRLLRSDEYLSFEELANKLSEVPWDVLRACRDLVRDGVATEARGKARGRFRLIH
jgi:hypothetical protein